MGNCLSKFSIQHNLNMPDDDDWKIKPMVVEDNNLAAAWHLWRRNYRVYCLANADKEWGEPKKVANFLLSIGNEGGKIFWSKFPNVSEETLKDVTLEQVFKAFDEHCEPLKNIPMESHKFHSLRQKEGQTIADFVTELREQAAKCEFTCQCKKSYMDREIRDRLITGVADVKLRNRLLDQKDVTLVSVLQMCQNYEATREGSKELDKSVVSCVQTEETKEVCTVSGQERRCFSCGFAPFNNAHKELCPAKNIICRGCNEKGHYQRTCRKNRKPTVAGRKVRAITQLSGTFMVNGVKSKKWIRKYNVNGRVIPFKVDTGAEVNCIPISFVQKNIRRTRVRLIDYNNNPIKTLGEVQLNCMDEKTRVNHRAMFIVVDDLLEPILGLNTAEEFGLIRTAEINSIAEGSKDSFLTKYSEVFDGLGKIPGCVKIQLIEGSVPKKHYHKRFPLSVKDKLKIELEALVKEGIISEITEPTEWINNLQVVEKPNGKIRLCLDPRPLNECIKREHYIIPTKETLTADLAEFEVFSVLDLTSGFWHLELDPDSAKLTTFITPYGRYYWKRLPFGLSCAPEIFQRKMVEIFGDIPGVLNYFDDLFIGGKNEADHDRALKEVMKRAMQFNIKFNPSKIQYKSRKVVFMGQVISKEGMEIHRKYSDAIAEMETPVDKAGVSRFLGLLKYVSGYIPQLSAISKNLRELTRNDTVFTWEERHRKEFQLLKDLVLSDQVLANFDPSKKIVIQTDASKDGLGCTLVQDGKPVAFASRTLGKNEKNWSQIEKELLAIVFACIRFNYYVYGRQFLVESDHKPLETLYVRNIDEVPIRLQRMMIFLLKYPMMKVTFKPGKDMLIADCLSRAQVKDVEEINELSVMVHSITRRVCVSKKNFESYLRAMECDEKYKRICEFVKSGWPGYHKLDTFAQQFYKVKSELHYENGLLLWGDRLVVPEPLQSKIAHWLHEPHLGIEKTLARARQLYFWPGMYSIVKEIVETCKVCEKFPRNNQKEPLKSDELPRYPYHIVGMDIFEWKGEDYISVLDSYSNYLVAIPLRNKTSGHVIEKIKEVFERIGYPSVIRADNSPFSSAEFEKFANDSNVEFRFSSPRYPQSNGLAEKGVAIAKNILKRCVEEGFKGKFQQGILGYNSSPVASLGFAPCELFFGRKIKTTLPVVESTLMRRQIKEEVISIKIAEKRGKQKEFYDKGAKELELLVKGDRVMFKKDENMWVYGNIEEIGNGRSYVVKDRVGNLYRRNRRLIRKSKVKDSAIIDIETKELYDDYLVEGNDEVENNDSINMSLQEDSQDQSLSGSEVEEYSTAQSLSSSDVEELPQEAVVEQRTRSGREIKMPRYLNEYELR